MNNNQGLISLALKTVGSKIVGRQVLKDLEPILKINQISSFYSYSHGNEMTLGHLDQLIIGVLNFYTELSLDQLIRIIKSLNDSNFDINSLEGFNILVFSNTVSMSPELTLPCPSLLSNQVILGCAVEVWPDYEHPLFKQTLESIEYSNPNRQSSRFYMQGTDFLKPL